MQTLKRGSRGAEVKTLQGYLNLIADGIFGALTEEAVKEFQRNYGLTADGIVGDRTWAQLKARAIPSVAIRADGHLVVQRTTRRINELIVHCTATPEGKDYTVDTIRSWHTKPKAQGGRGWSDIGYHYVIYRDGSIHVGRDINKIGAHCENHNTGSIGIVYVGGTEATKGADGKYKAKDTRTKEQRTTLRSLIRELRALYDLPASAVHGHYEYANKSCPSFRMADL